MEAFSLEAEGEADLDELSGEELRAAFPATWRQEATVSSGLAKVYVLGLARVGASVLSRAALCHGIRRVAPQHTCLAGLHAREEGLLVLAGSSYTASPCLRLSMVKSRKAKPVADLGAAGGATARCSLMMEEGTLLTGGEDGVIRLWREGGEGEGAEVKGESGKIVTKSKVRDKPY